MAALALRAAPRPFKRKVADRSGASWATDGGPGARGFREDLDASRAAAAESTALPGFAARSASPPRAATSSPRSARTPPRRSTTPAGRPRQRRDRLRGRLPGRVRRPGARPRPVAADQPRAWTCRWTRSPPSRSRGADGGRRTSGSWPVPSPPPVGEAPPSAYDPLNDTGYNIPVYGNPAVAVTGSSDVYDTGETNNLYGTYNTQRHVRQRSHALTHCPVRLRRSGLRRTLERAFRRL